MKNEYRCHGDTSVNRILLLRGFVVTSFKGRASIEIQVSVCCSCTTWSILVKLSSYIGGTMAEKPAAVGNRLGKCMLHNWVEEVSLLLTLTLVTEKLAWLMLVSRQTVC